MPDVIDLIRHHGDKGFELSVGPVAFGFHVSVDWSTHAGLEVDVTTRTPRWLRVWTLVREQRQAR